MGLPADGGLPRGARLGVDVGTVRIGLAASDPDGLIATPVETVKRATDGSDIRRIAAEVVDRSAAVVYVGLPRHLSGAESASSQAIRSYADALATAVAPAAVHLIDERLTTVTAHQVLHTAGRSSKKHRAVVDQVAAVVILQSALDLERGSGRRAGRVVRVSTADKTPTAADGPAGDEERTYQ